MTRNPIRGLATLLVAGSMVLLSACSGSTAGSTPSASALPSLDPSKQTTITFMEAMSSGAQQAALKKMTADFEAQHPNVTVQLQEQPNYGALQTKITAQVAANSAPTIAQVYENWADELSSSNVIVPLDEYVASSKDYKDFYSGIQADMKLRDGKNWMWPFNKSVVVQYYNESLVPKAPATWGEFAQTAKSVSKNGVVALSIDPGSETSPAGGTALFEILAESFGTPVFAKDGTPQFDSDAAKKALNYLVDLKKSNALALGTNYPGQTALGNQTGAFDVSSVASYPFNQKAVGGKFVMGVAPLPAGTAKTANQLAGTNIAMFSSADDQQKAAAWAYMQFLTSPAEMAYWASQTGYLPVVKTAMDEQAMKDYLAKNPWVGDVVKQLDTATPLPPVSYVNKASGALSTAISSAVNGTASVDDALAQAQAAGKKAASES
ncbi:multiple sugar transport system substrate-binding protein [Propionibacterium cyclohexanicum]|uniref:Multiple sugar transport system substrate-binding protein n=1 Tax=Propionibacterium cyclohexanicum TaxID=64702 RepID=A0A1H9TVK5_9ACTN|nr:ABC transporter substrate-binding protein [Propionibacterium cyclohexanicum]SES01400.1 multiple sugar transport system substrate-binding protein [Propionibacterium cyclohexanicum]